ncbi:MAG: helix-turn-helix domain-containing protein [Rhizobiales bacterium]|nr:helix-turn-helix domain-containing protein [Hyphomicrobiales bacterium]
MCRICERRSVILDLLESGLVTAEECAEKVNVSTRTIYRDIVRMRREGQPIVGEAGVGYVLRRREARHAG